MRKEEFVIPGQPVGKGRPRVTRYGTFTPQKTREYEERVRGCWDTQCGEKFDDGPLRAVIKAFFIVPASYSKKRRAELDGKWHTKKCDADNLAKCVLDALNGYAYPDDSAVASLVVRKYYTTGAPRVEVEICELEE